MATKRKKLSTSRVKLVTQLDKALEREVAKLQREFEREVMEFMTKELDVKDGKIVNSTRNQAKLFKMEAKAQEFSDRHSKRVARQMAAGMGKIIVANEAYFLNQAKVPKQLRNKLRRDLLASYGYKKVKGKFTIVAGSWLANLAKTDRVFDTVQEIGINAVARGVPLDSFRKQVTKAAFGSGLGSISHHFRTKAKDTYAQFDRSAHVQYAEELSFRAFIYEGGTIDTTRDFCERNNGKVFLISEAESLWPSQEWSGKNESYEAMRDMGGHNCRHHPSFISDALAIQLRPELKDILGKAA